MFVEVFPQRQSRHWYLIYSKVRQEAVAKKHLERQGYETYLPLLQQQRRRRGRWVDVVEPLFPRYLFIHLDAHLDNWAPIRSTVGVAKIVRFGANAAQVPDPLIAALMQNEDDNGFHHLKGEPEVRVGDKIRVVDGMMAGYEGIVTARSSLQRVEILLTTVANAAKCWLSADQIQRV